MSPRETDPNNIGQHDPGAKLDSGKPRVGLVLGSFARALWEVSRIGTFGANKYSDNGWLKVERANERYKDAQLRHWLKLEMGETLDPDSELHHLAHEAWNALAVLELKLREKDTDHDETDKDNQVSQTGDLSYVHN